MKYTIKHVCEELDLTVHTVRHYCDMGLVPNLMHDKNGNRIFDEESINWLRAATFLRASGLPVSEIREYFELCLKGESTIRERQGILIWLKEKSQEELEATKHRIECLGEKIDLCQNVIDGKCEDDSNPLNW